MTVFSEEDLTPAPPEEAVGKSQLTEATSVHMAPVFITPLVGATVQEGVKFSFECRLVMHYYTPVQRFASLFLFVICSKAGFLRVRKDNYSQELLVPVMNKIEN